MSWFDVGYLIVCAAGLCMVGWICWRLREEYDEY
jgi:hypothetical protein